MVEDLKKNNISLKILARTGAQIDTCTSNGRMICGLFAILAEFTRDLIVECTRVGLAAVTARKRKGGRPHNMAQLTLVMAMSAIANLKSGIKEVAKRFGMTTTTLYMYVDGNGSAKEIATKLLQFP